MGIVTLPYTGAYSASKFALEAYSDALRAELHKQRIRVVSLQIGFYQSNIYPNSRFLNYTEEEKKIISTHYPTASKFVVDSRNSPESTPVSKKILQVIVSKSPYPAYTMGVIERYLCLLASVLPRFVLDLLRDFLAQIEPPQIF